MNQSKKYLDENTILKPLKKSSLRLLLCCDTKILFLSLSKKVVGVCFYVLWFEIYEHVVPVRWKKGFAFAGLRWFLRCLVGFQLEKPLVFSFAGLRRILRSFSTRKSRTLSPACQRVSVGFYMWWYLRLMRRVIAGLSRCQCTILHVVVLGTNEKGVSDKWEREKDPSIAIRLINLISETCEGLFRIVRNRCWQNGDHVALRNVGR